MIVFGHLDNCRLFPKFLALSVNWKKAGKCDEIWEPVPRHQKMSRRLDFSWLWSVIIHRPRHNNQSLSNKLVFCLGITFLMLGVSNVWKKKLEFLCKPFVYSLCPQLFSYNPKQSLNCFSQAPSLLFVCFTFPISDLISLFSLFNSERSPSTFGDFVTHDLLFGYTFRI